MGLTDVLKKSVGVVGRGVIQGARYVGKVANYTPKPSKSFLLGSGIVLSSFLFPRKADADFITNVFESGQVRTNVALAIDNNSSSARAHILYSKGDEMVYSNSDANDKYQFSTQSTLASGLSNYQKPEIIVDSRGDAHGVFVADRGGEDYSTFYINSRDRVLNDLGYGNRMGYLDIGISPENEIVIGTQHNFGTQASPNLDVVLLKSKDGSSFSPQRIAKSHNQLNPSFDFDSKGNVHLAYWDWSEGIVGGLKHYKTRYATSLDDFLNSSVVALYDQSYGAHLEVSSEDVPYVLIKDSDMISSNDFTTGTIHMINLNTGEIREIVGAPIDFPKNLPEEENDPRPLDFSLYFGEAHVSWAENDRLGIDGTGDPQDPSDDCVRIIYTWTGQPHLRHDLYDIGTNPLLGWADIDTFRDSPIIVSNLHSGVDFVDSKLTRIPEPATSSLLLLGGLVGGYSFLRKRRLRQRIKFQEN